MTDRNIFVCALADSVAHVPSQRMVCGGCEREVWMSLATLDAYKEAGGDIRCLLCAASEMLDQKEIAVAFTREQLAEIADALGRNN